MNRRGFIKRGALWVPAIVGLKAYPQALTLADPAKVLSTPTPKTCQLFTQSTDDNDYYTTATDIAQKIKVTAEIEICQIDLKLFWLSGTTGEVKIQCWSNSNRTGTQYGSDSTSIVVTSGVYFPASWGTFTFASNPTINTDFWICLVEVATQDVGWRISYNHVPGSGYYPYIDATADEAYCAYAYGANRTTTDACFKLYTMQ